MKRIFGPRIRTTTFLVLALGILCVGAVISVTAQGQSSTIALLQQTSKIVFTSKRDGHKQIYIMNVDGGNEVNISQNKFSDSEPAWSPYGTQIAFASRREGNNEICVMNADGSDQHCLTHNPTP